jgi:hypothetical protein
MPTGARPTLLRPHAVGPAGAKPKLYNPRHPERTLLYQTGTLTEIACLVLRPAPPPPNSFIIRGVAQSHESLMVFAQGKLSLMGKSMASQSIVQLVNIL